MNTLTLNPNPDLKITMIISTHNSSTHIPYMMQQSTILFAQRICRISSCLYLLMFQSSFDYCTLETGLDCTLHHSYILLNDRFENLSFAYILVKNWKNACNLWVRRYHAIQGLGVCSLIQWTTPFGYLNTIKGESRINSNPDPNENKLIVNL